MAINARCVLALFALAFLAAEERPGIPGADPLPHLVPQVPGKVEEISPEQQLLWRLGRKVQEHDRRIAELNLRVPLGSRPIAINDPTLEKPRQEREQALLELRRAMDAYGGHRSRRDDALEVARPAAKAVQAGPIAQVNQLRIAECYQELLQDAKGGTAADLATGVQTLNACDVKGLPSLEQPRWWYLKTWFAAEGARRADGDARAQLLAEAQEAQRTLASTYPGLELTTAAQALTLDLTRVQPAPGVVP